MYQAIKARSCVDNLGEAVTEFWGNDAPTYSLLYLILTVRKPGWRKIQRHGEVRNSKQTTRPKDARVPPKLKMEDFWSLWARRSHSLSKTAQEGIQWSVGFTSKLRCEAPWRLQRKRLKAFGNLSHRDAPQSECVDARVVSVGLERALRAEKHAMSCLGCLLAARRFSLGSSG